ncbi:MAG: PAS domain-containing protein [Alphaproteobacteria bacterium]
MPSAPEDRASQRASPRSTAASGTAAQRLHDVLRLSSEWLYETDAELTVTFMSDRVHDDLGVVPAAMIGRRLPELGVFDAGPDAFAAQLDPSRRKPFADRMADMRHADGSLRRIRFAGVPMYEDGGFAGYRGIARDETLRLSAVDAAQRAESRLLMGLAAIRDGFAVFDSLGMLICANPQLADDFGRRDGVPPGIELAKLLNHALKSGWFVDTDASSLTAAPPRLTDPASGQSMVEIGLADGRRVLFCASRTDCGDTVLISTDITALQSAQRGGARRSTLKSA